MYFWKVHELARDLREGKISEKEKIKYYLLYIFVDSVIIESGTYYSETVNIFLILESLLFITFSVLGTWVCYKANAQGDNKDFIERFICLSWPISVKLMVFTLAFLFIYIVTVYIIAGESGEKFDAFIEEQKIIDLLLVTVLLLIYFLWLRTKILWVARSEEEEHC